MSVLNRLNCRVMHVMVYLYVHTACMIYLLSCIRTCPRYPQASKETKKVSVKDQAASIADKIGTIMAHMRRLRDSDIRLRQVTYFVMLSSMMCCLGFCKRGGSALSSASHCLLAVCGSVLHSSSPSCHAASIPPSLSIYLSLSFYRYLSRQLANAPTTKLPSSRNW